MKTWQFSDQLYNIDYFLVVCSLKELEDYMVSEFGWPREINDAAGRIFWVSDRDVRPAAVIWMPAFSIATYQIGTLAHEVFHAVCCAMGRAEIELVDASEEAFAYYTSWLMEQCFKRLVTVDNKTS